MDGEIGTREAVNRSEETLWLQFGRRFIERNEACSFTAWVKGPSPAVLHGE